MIDNNANFLKDIGLLANDSSDQSIRVFENFDLKLEADGSKIIGKVFKGVDCHTYAVKGLRIFLRKYPIVNAGLFFVYFFTSKVECF